MLQVGKEVRAIFRDRVQGERGEENRIVRLAMCQKAVAPISKWWSDSVANPSTLRSNLPPLCGGLSGNAPKSSPLSSAHFVPPPPTKGAGRPSTVFITPTATSHTPTWPKANQNNLFGELELNENPISISTFRFSGCLFVSSSPAPLA